MAFFSTIKSMQAFIDTKKRKRTISEKLRKDIEENKTVGAERRFYIHLPIKHEFHIKGEVLYAITLLTWYNHKK